MTGGRVVSATLPTGSATAVAVAALEALDQVSSVRLSGQRISVTGPTPMRQLVCCWASLPRAI
ncbi:hypothetical protein [Arthrobacter psychrolactophilus]